MLQKSHGTGDPGRRHAAGVSRQAPPQKARPKERPSLDKGGEKVPPAFLDVFALSSEQIQIV